MSKKQKVLTELIESSIKQKIIGLLFVLLVSMVVYSVASAGFSASSAEVQTLLADNKILINQGAIATNDPNVRLNFDGVPGGRLSVSQDKNAGGSTFVPYSSFRNFQIKGPDGEYEIFVKFFDRQGNFAGLHSDTIIIDRVSPEAPQIFGPAARVRIPEYLLIFRGLTEPNADIFLQIDGMAYKTRANADGYWGMRLPSPVTPDIEHEYCVWADDTAGNVSERTCSTVISVE